jgi:hypothetical protein
MGKILIFKSFLFSGYQPEMTDLLILTEVIGTTAYKEFVKFGSVVSEEKI